MTKATKKTLYKTRKKLTSEGVKARLWSEGNDPNSTAANRVAALRALADAFGLLRGGSKGDEGDLPELPIRLQAEADEIDDESTPE